jgi:hypothetical protein
MSELIDFLNSRISQLEDRKMMIPRYVKRSGKFAGKKKDFSLADLPKIQEKINETKAALVGIKKWRSDFKVKK